MHVLKFGGTSVANSKNIEKVVEIVQQSILNHKSFVVVSALSGITDLLIETADLASVQDELYQKRLKTIEEKHIQTVKELIPLLNQSSILSQVMKMCNELENLCDGIALIGELSARAKDKIIGYGELLSSLIISAKFSSVHLENEWVDARKVIRTNSNFGLAEVDFEVTNKILNELLSKSNRQLFVMPGFIAGSPDGISTTLGRGGSDYSASIIAAAINTSVLEIWTDVSGVMTADPRLVSNSKVIPRISYFEAMELSHFGAKVIYPPTIKPVMDKNIPIWIKNTFSPKDYGTLIESEVPNQNKNLICGLTSIKKIALLNFEGSGMVGIPGISMRLFGALSKDKINVILITQASSEHSICIAVEDSSAEAAKLAADTEFEHEINAGIVDPIKVEADHSIIALVGDNMKSMPGISGKMFGALGRNGINIRAIAQGSSEKNISAVVKTSDVEKAINVLHEDFFEDEVKQLNLFLVGVGNVGGKLLSQLQQQKNYLQKHLHLQVNIVGIANSKKMLLDVSGISLENWNEQLNNGATTDLNEFVSFIHSNNLRNSVFVDVTSNQNVTDYYGGLLKKSIAVVACNKIASSSSYAVYSDLKKLAQKYNTSYLFETNVGASLPVIGTLKDLMQSGDKVIKIEAVLSGTLNFVFNTYDGTETFSSVVQQARDEGYAEPDPRIDLSGIDVMRKILILARESGIAMEMDEIVSSSFLPEECMKGDVSAFYDSMLKHESHFKSLYSTAEREGCRLKFVAKLENGKASVGLQHIGEGHDLFHLYGKDNVVLFYTNRYSEQPLVIKGAGAGADVTASGIFADILRTVKI
ncbi:MAG: bifunctional aspartate kinase/homoserine dehydrogenase I [Flavobacteriia bacterium]|nr:bifunctional aspartate kinase/homoserine dehydrogenase I [Flavobacteriia bacterium]